MNLKTITLNLKQSTQSKIYYKVLHLHKGQIGLTNPYRWGQRQWVLLRSQEEKWDGFQLQMESCYLIIQWLHGCTPLSAFIVSEFNKFQIFNVCPIDFNFQVQLKKTKIMVFWGFFLATAGDAQGLLLVLHSLLIPGKLSGPYRMQGIKPRLSTCKTSILPCVLLLWS